MMRNTTIKNLFIVCLLAFASKVTAQITIDNTTYTNPNPAQSLIQNVLLGQGVQAFNFNFVGQPDQIGFFKNTGTPFGLDSGVVMSTGSVLDVPQTATDFASTAYSLTPTDVDLQTILGAGVDANDVAVLEFDFIPIGDSVKFEYVFASEEYPQFVCSYNDVFGFFLSGPGITGPYSNNSANIALIPGTSTPVSIANVNNGQGNDPNAPGCPAVNPQYYVNNTGTSYVVYNGSTVVLTALAQVTCGETYHVKMALADAGDWSYDSGVFLRAKSFVSSAVAVQSATLSGDSTIVEGCSEGAFTFYRPGAALDSLILPITVSGTAIEGTDYNFLPDTIIFVPGVSSITIPITPVADGIAEGAESIIISFTQDLCGIVNITSSLYIVPLQTITASAPDVTVPCPGSSVNISTQFVGGYPPYTITWDTGENTNTITVNPATTTFYTYTVSDTCGSPAVTDSILVIVPPGSQLAITGSDTVVCAGTNVLLTTTITGGIPPYNYQWTQNGSNVGSLSTLNIIVNSSEIYVVSVTDGCGLVTATDTVYASLLALTPIVVSVATDTIVCPGDSATLVAFITGGGAPYGSIWTIGGTQLGVGGIYSTGALTQTTTYTITVTDACGSAPGTANGIALVLPYTPLIVDLGTDKTVSCPNDNALLTANVSNGVGAYSYVWGAGVTPANPSNTGNVTPSATTTYTVAVTDICNYAPVTDTINVIVPVYPAVVVSGSIDTAVCKGNTVLMTVIAQDGNGSYTYLWQPTTASGDTGIANSAMIDANTIFIVTATDGCGNTGFDSIVVSLRKDCEVIIPNVITPNGDATNQYLVIENIELFPQTKLEVFNRWGNRVFQSDNYDNKWDGGNLSAGTYFYTLDLGEDFEARKGFFQLMK